MNILNLSQDYLLLTVLAFVSSTILLLSIGHQNKNTSKLLSVILYSLQLMLAYGVSIYFGHQINLQIVAIIFILGLPFIIFNNTWNSYGKVSYALLVQASLGFVVFVVYKSLNASVAVHEFVIAILISMLILSAMVLAMVQGFELIDVVCRVKWNRLVAAKSDSNYFPKVSLHVPAYNEPPEMVIATLNALANIDYPDYEVIMIDDNTVDENLWRPVEAHCKKLGFKFYHLENWPGFKSGALNFANTKTHEDAEIIGIVDADYIVEENYLKDLVGHFENNNVAFVQTPQDYRDFDKNDRYLMALYNAYQYFFKLSMASRNERNGIIFTGTMGLIRKRVLLQVGGWDEWCITEDAEIAVKILDKGYESIYIDKTYGRGLMPLDFESLKKQRFRWAFGGMQVLRLHWKKLLPWSSSKSTGDGKLNLGQKLDFWAGGLQWLNDPLTFLFTLFLFINSLIYLFADNHSLNHMLGIVMFVPFVFIFTNLARTLWGLKLRLNCTYAQAFQTLLMLLSLTWVVTKACVLGFTQKAGVFLRTPKQKSNYGLVKVIRIVDSELLIVSLCLVSMFSLLIISVNSATAIVLVSLLLWQTVIYTSSIIASYWSYRSNLSLAKSVDCNDLDSEAVATAET